MRFILRTAFILGLFALPQPAGAQAPYVPPRQAHVPIYRLFSPGTGDHAYTADPYEAAPGYNMEGMTFFVATRSRPGFMPLYRCLGPTGHYLDTVPGPGAEGRLGWISRWARPGTEPLYIWYNPELGLNFYTPDPNGELAPEGGYQYAGVLGYVFSG
jgi:hypothetical protein